MPLEKQRRHKNFGTAMTKDLKWSGFSSFAKDRKAWAGFYFLSPAKLQAKVIPKVWLRSGLFVEPNF